MNADRGNKGLTAYISKENAIGTSTFFKPFENSVSEGRPKPVRERPPRRLSNYLPRRTPNVLESAPARRGLEVYMETVLDLPCVPDQTARCTKARLQILRTDDVVRRAAGSIEGMARA